MADELISLVHAGDMMIQYGVSIKTAPRKRVRFLEGFQIPPTMIVSPFLEGAPAGVGHAETIVRSEADHFVVTSSNAAANYYVSWIALGPRRGVSALENPTSVQWAHWLLRFGSLEKPDTSGASLEFEPPYPITPNVQLAPFWDGAGGGVGHAETIESIDTHGFAIRSDNMAGNYRVNWVATGPFSAAREPVDEHIIGEKLIKIGRTRKRGTTMRVSLDWGAGFTESPALMVTPFWAGQGCGVGHTETINRIEPRYFEVSSGNAASNYYVSWLAIGSFR